MKRTLFLLVFACVVAVSTTNANGFTPGNMQFVKANNAYANTFINPFANAKSLVYNYLWFTDIELTNLVGTYCDINTECNRLRTLYGGYSFTPTWHAGLNQFEFGYCAPLMIAVIYSDMSYT